MISEVQFSDAKWLQFWSSYKGLPHQQKAVALLGKHIREVDSGLLTDAAEWVELWRTPPVTPVAPPKFTPSSPFSYKITPNVTYGELACQSEARRFVAQHQCDSAVVIAKFVQKARDHFKRPAIITSGYRPPKINAEVGGASRSEHLYDAPDTGAVWGAEGIYSRGDEAGASAYQVGLLSLTP